MDSHCPSPVYIQVYILPSSDKTQKSGFFPLKWEGAQGNVNTVISLLEKNNPRVSASVGENFMI